MDDIGQALAQITMGPYISKAMALIGKSRKAGSNMFRHQLDTMAILVDYKMTDPILLKAAVIHDLFEECPGMPGVTRDEIVRVDADGQAVYDLVMEVTLRERDGRREPKSEFLRRIMETGSPRAKMVKLADRISNLVSLGFVHDDQFVRDVLAETRQFILPYAERVNPNMYREMYDLVADRENKLLLRNCSGSAGRTVAEKRTA